MKIEGTLTSKYGSDNGYIRFDVSGEHLELSLFITQIISAFALLDAEIEKSKKP